MLILRLLRGSTRSVVLAASCVAALLAGACTDPTSNRTGPLALAAEDTGQLFAMSGVPTYYPAGLNLTSRTVVVVAVFDDGTVPFDVAFDLLPSGQVRVLPPRTVALGPAVVPVSLELLKAGKPWAEVTEAPAEGYIRDTVQVVSVGEPIVMRVQAAVCSLQLAQTIAAKFVVDSVNIGGRRIYFRLVANPNCGRRGLVANQF